ncbi:MAG TPA: DEAD/DEAH box helicase family protein [Bacillota bacterium]|nr:DEAD/DEAH box helicase family protein [Bacillota bacterium]
MKIKFDPDLDYQRDAIDSVVQIFAGQEDCRADFAGDLVIGNRLRLSEEEILKNVRAIQLCNGLALSDTVSGMNFTVEMETGTGKTYVYLRTIFELNREYGFLKFIIVVPSIAIKEGVAKSLQMVEEHMRGLYDNVRFDHFIYDPASLSQVRNFATSDYIQIMIINIDAFRKSFVDPEKEHRANIIHRSHDRMMGARPIEFIQGTSPIVIIDEPQSVDTTAKSAEAIASLHPLCTLRYSATHVERHNMMYRLDPVDAYQRKLVKQVEVASVEASHGPSRPYVRLLGVDNTRGSITARIELDALHRGGAVRRVARSVRCGDDLQEVSGSRDVYTGYIVENICCERGNEHIMLARWPEAVRLNQPIGDLDDGEYKRIQIRTTIREHLDKELMLRPRGVKVLSLFFIDRVANYRWYDEDGNPRKGKYAQMFEEEYVKAMGDVKYRSLPEGADPAAAAESVHNGYFAIDRRRDAAGRDMFRESRGDGVAQADESAYQLIMRDKEKLASFESGLKFIFSHSALREGWDNPNVFQICTLNDTVSAMKKRQEIGRGLRLAVNQDGERVYGFDVNTLTVVANQSYAEFVRQLQSEIEEDTGVRLGEARRLNVKNAAERRQVGPGGSNGVGTSPEPGPKQECNTGYRVTFDTDELIRRCAGEIRRMPAIDHTGPMIRKARLGMGRGGIGAGDVRVSAEIHEAHGHPLPDIVTQLQNDTSLTRRTIVKILVQSGRLEDFKAGPQVFIEKVSAIIRRRVGLCIQEGGTHAGTGS